MPSQRPLAEHWHARCGAGGDGSGGGGGGGGKPAGRGAPLPFWGGGGRRAAGGGGAGGGWGGGEGLLPVPPPREHSGVRFSTTTLELKSPSCSVIERSGGSTTRRLAMPASREPGFDGKQTLLPCQCRGLLTRASEARTPHGEEEGFVWLPRSAAAKSPSQGWMASRPRTPSGRWNVTLTSASCGTAPRPTAGRRVPPGPNAQSGASEEGSGSDGERTGACASRGHTAGCAGVCRPRIEVSAFECKEKRSGTRLVPSRGGRGGWPAGVARGGHPDRVEPLRLRVVAGRVAAGARSVAALITPLAARPHQPQHASHLRARRRGARSLTGLLVVTLRCQARASGRPSPSRLTSARPPQASNTTYRTSYTAPSANGPAEASRKVPSELLKLVATLCPSSRDRSPQAAPTSSSTAKRYAWAQSGRVQLVGGHTSTPAERSAPSASDATTPGSQGWRCVGGWSGRQRTKGWPKGNSTTCEATVERPTRTPIRVRSSARSKRSRGAQGQGVAVSPLRPGPR